MEFITEMPAQVSMVVSAIVPIFLSFVIRFVKSKRWRKVIGYGASIIIGFIGAKVAGAGTIDYFFLIASTCGLGYLAYKKWFHSLIKNLEGSGE